MLVIKKTPFVKCLPLRHFFLCIVKCPVQESDEAPTKRVYVSLTKNCNFFRPTPYLIKIQIISVKSPLISKYLISPSLSVRFMSGGTAMCFLCIMLRWSQDTSRVLPAPTNEPPSGARYWLRMHTSSRPNLRRLRAFFRTR